MRGEWRGGEGGHLVFHAGVGGFISPTKNKHTLIGENNDLGYWNVLALWIVIS